MAGFGACSRCSGVTATFAGGVLADYLPPLRIIGGVILIVMGLSLAGILRVGFLERTWRPLDAGASASLATMTGGMALAPAGGGGDGRRQASAAGSSAAGSGSGAAFTLGSIFADRLDAVHRRDPRRRC